MRRITNCQSCQNSFWSPTRKMFIVWAVKPIEKDGKVELQKLKTFGAFYSFVEADAKKVTLNEGEEKFIQKYYMPINQLCGSCKRLETSIKKRIAKDKKRPPAVISEENRKGYMRFLIDKKIEAEAKEKK
jgi:hypothetical protein